ncbi:MAG: S-layer homology domain-containing protein [Ruminococcaceae bacterium]|nr:S-layer homology domain-containing protein [Oscillospiraceae bacterium]
MIKRFIAVSVALYAVLTSTAIGVCAKVTTDFEKSVVTVNGIVESEKDGVMIGIEVFAPDKSYEDLNSVPFDKVSGVVANFGQTVSETNGKWEYEFKIFDNPAVNYDAKSGEYTIVIFPDDAGESYTERFIYVNLDEAKTVIEQLKAAQKQEYAGIINSGKDALGVNYKFYESLDIEKIADRLFDEVSSGIFEEKTIAECVNVVQGNVLLEALNKGKINNILEYTKYFRLDSSDIAPFLEKDYVLNNGESITDWLSEMGFEAFSSFEEKFIEATVLCVVKNPDGEGNVKEITEAFANKIGFTAPLSNKAYRGVMGNEYESYAKLLEALNGKNESGNFGGSGGGGGSSGGGGGSSSGGKKENTVSSGTYIPKETEKAEQMNVDIFNDISEISWAKDAIVYLAQKGIVNGKSDNMFCPNDIVTREEAAKILVMAFAKDAEETEISFTDVDKNSWYYSYVAKALSTGIIKGYSDEIFGSGDMITREDLVTMIYRAAKLNGISLETAPIGFSDENEIADYAKEAVGALADAEIVSGVDFATFAPKQPASRAQMAKIVYRLMEL